MPPPPGMATPPPLMPPPPPPPTLPFSLPPPRAFPSAEQFAELSRPAPPSAAAPPNAPHAPRPPPAAPTPDPPPPRPPASEPTPGSGPGSGRETPNSAYPWRPTPGPKTHAHCPQVPVEFFWTAAGAGAGAGAPPPRRATALHDDILLSGPRGKGGAAPWLAGAAFAGHGRGAPRAAPRPPRGPGATAAPGPGWPPPDPAMDWSWVAGMMPSVPPFKETALYPNPQRVFVKEMPGPGPYHKDVPGPAPGPGPAREAPPGPAQGHRFAAGGRRGEAFGPSAFRGSWVDPPNAPPNLFGPPLRDKLFWF